MSSKVTVYRGILGFEGAKITLADLNFYLLDSGITYRQYFGVKMCQMYSGSDLWNRLVIMYQITTQGFGTIS